MGSPGHEFRLKWSNGAPVIPKYRCDRSRRAPLGYFMLGQFKGLAADANGHDGDFPTRHRYPSQTGRSQQPRRSKTRRTRHRPGSPYRRPSHYRQAIGREAEGRGPEAGRGALFRRRSGQGPSQRSQRITRGSEGRARGRDVLWRSLRCDARKSRRTSRKRSG